MKTKSILVGIRSLLPGVLIAAGEVRRNRMKAMLIQMNAKTNEFSEYRLRLIGTVALFLISLPGRCPAAEPELFVPGATPFDLSVSGGQMYWEELRVDPCQTMIRTTNVAGFPHPNEWTGCLFSRQGILSRGNSFIAFNNDGSLSQFWRNARIRRLALTTGITTDGARRLAYYGAPMVEGFLSDQFLYWADHAGVHRVVLSGAFTVFGAIEPEITVQNVVSLPPLAEPASWLAADATHVYWWQLDHQGWGIFRAPVTGGSPELVYRTTGVGAYLALDETRIYWTESGARVGVATKGTPITSPTFYSSPIPDAVARGLVVDSRNVYWTQRRETAEPHVTLRRCAKDVFPPLPEDLALGIGANHLEQDGFYLYWSDSHGIKRLAKDAVPATVDFTIAAVEITQGIQNIDNNVPLVQDKPTFVRVYPVAQIEGAPRMEASAILHVTTLRIAPKVLLPGRGVEEAKKDTLRQK